MDIVKRYMTVGTPHLPWWAKVLLGALFGAASISSVLASAVPTYHLEVGLVSLERPYRADGWFEGRPDYYVQVTKRDPAVESEIKQLKAERQDLESSLEESKARLEEARVAVDSQAEDPKSQDGEVSELASEIERMQKDIAELTAAERAARAKIESRTGVVTTGGDRIHFSDSRATFTVTEGDIIGISLLEDESDADDLVASAGPIVVDVRWLGGSATLELGRRATVNLLFPVAKQ